MNWFSVHPVAGDGEAGLVIDGAPIRVDPDVGRISPFEVVRDIDVVGAVLPCAVDQVEQAVYGGDFRLDLSLPTAAAAGSSNPYTSATSPSRTVTSNIPINSCSPQEESSTKR
jgi:hypothetical protein